MTIDIESLTTDELLKLRKEYKQKKELYHGYSNAIKIILNGGYGAMSNEYMRWFSDDLAESITLSGQMASKWVEKTVNRFLNRRMKTENHDYIVAIDTDSCYVNVDRVVERVFPDGTDEDSLLDFLHNLAKEIEKVIANGLEEMYEETNAFQKALHMKLESIGTALWTTKKRYVMSVKSFKGVRYNPPRLKIQGIEAVRSSTPAVCREAIEEAIPKILERDPVYLKSFFEEVREKFMNSPFNMVARPSSVNDIEKYTDSKGLYIKGTPIHVRAAILYNDLVKRNGLEKSLPLIQSGDKIRYCYLRIPNPIKENAIAVPDELPKEFKDLEDFIDYELQYEKTFEKPILKLLEAAQIEITDNIDIEQFFVSEE